MGCLNLIFVIGMFLLIQTGNSNSEKIDVAFNPTHYDITLRLITEDKSPVAKQFTAPGKITIDGVSNIATDELLLSVGKDVEIIPHSVIIIAGEQTSILTVKNVTHDSRRLIIQVYPGLKPNQNVTVYLEFISQISPTCDNWGSENGNICYTNGTTDQALFSSSEPSNMFPFFNPYRKGKKATFSLKLIRQNELNNTIANAGLATSIPDPAHPGWTVDTMKKTANMFTDNFAFVVSNYGYIEMTFGKHNKTFRLHAPSKDFTLDKSKLEHIATDCVSLLNGSEEYFNDSQSVPKFDAVLSPIGATLDTWGINVLSKDYKSSFFRMGTKLQYFEWFARTIPAQWILNIFKNNQISAEFVRFTSSKIRAAINKDDGDYQTGNTRDLFFQLQFSPSLNYFNGYLLMLESIITPETVKKGVFNFLNGGHPALEEFYTSLQNAAETDGRNLRNLAVKNIFDMWNHQEGYPLLRVGSISNNHFNISLEAVGSFSQINSDGNWTVAVNFKKTHKNFLIDTQEKNVIVNASLVEWIKFSGRGYHRTVFDDNATQWIQQQLESNFESFDTLARAYLLQDYNILAKQGLLSYTKTLNLMKYISNETQPIVYNEFVSFMEELHKKFLFSPHYTVIKNYTSKKLGDLWKTAGVADSTTSILYYFAFKLGESFTYPYAKSNILDWNATGVLDSKLTSSSIAEAMLCSMVANGGKSAFEFALGEYDKSIKLDSIRGRYIAKALACAKHESLIHELLNKTLTKKLKGALAPLAGKEIGQMLVLPFLSANWDQLVGNGTNHDFELWSIASVGSIVETLSHRMSTASQLKNLEDFIKTHENSVKTIKVELDIAVEQVKQNIVWMDTQGKEIVEWMKLQE